MEIRAVVTIELYVYGETDSEITEKAALIASKLREKEDNDARVTSIVEQPFGILKNRKIV